MLLLLWVLSQLGYSCLDDIFAQVVGISLWLLFQMHPILGQGFVKMVLGSALHLHTIQDRWAIVWGRIFVQQVGKEGVVGFWVVVVGVVMILYFQHCLDCCHVHLHCQSCQIHLHCWCWHVELAKRVGDPILLVVLEVECHGGWGVRLADSNTFRLRLFNPMFERSIVVDAF